MANETLSCQKTLGKNLRRLRQRLQLTQANLAERINVSINFISEIESGKVWVSAETLDKICAYFNVSPDKLFKTEETTLTKNQKEIDTALQSIETELSAKISELRTIIFRNT